MAPVPETLPVAAVFVVTLQWFAVPLVVTLTRSEAVIPLLCDKKPPGDKHVSVIVQFWPVLGQFAYSNEIMLVALHERLVDPPHAQLLQLRVSE
jgi:hypothetical protein